MAAASNPTNMAMNLLWCRCGWGGFALRAVQRTGCRVTGLTLSKEQLAEANARVKAAGLQDSITLLFCDYRDVQGGWWCVALN